MSLNLDHLAPDHFTKIHAYTPHIYRDQYPSIDPSSSALSQAGKVIIITGASSGIGATGWAPAFAKANPKAMVLVGRNAERLQKTCDKIKSINGEVEVVPYGAEISDAESVEKLFAMVKEKFGKADVLVNNAGTFASNALVGDSDPKKWWSDFEANVKAAYLMTRGFIGLLDGAKATVITMSTDQATQVFGSVSSYGISKMAVVRLMEFVAVEYPNVCAVAIQPGVVMSPMIIGPYKKFALDTPELVGGSGVWLATHEARFLSGRFVSANWSVDDMKMMKSQIEGGEDLKLVYQGNFGIEG